MTYLQKKALFVGAFVLIFSWSLSAPSLAEAVEQTVRIDATKPADGNSSARVQAVFRGDHDNRSNDYQGALIARRESARYTRQENMSPGK